MSLLSRDLSVSSEASSYNSQIVPRVVLKPNDLSETSDFAVEVQSLFERAAYRSITNNEAISLGTRVFFQIPIEQFGQISLATKTKILFILLKARLYNSDQIRALACYFLPFLDFDPCIESENQFAIRFFQAIFSEDVNQINNCLLFGPPRKHFIALHLAACLNNSRLFIERYTPDVAREKDMYGNTLLHLAVATGSVSMVQWILQNGNLDLNARNLQGMTPLHLACKKGNKALIDLLITNIQKDIAVMNQKTIDGLTSWAILAKEDHIKVLVAILKQYQCESYFLVTRWTEDLLSHACQGQARTAISYFIQKLVEFEEPTYFMTEEGRELFLNCCRMGLQVSLSTILENTTFDLLREIETEGHENALHLAARHGHENLIEYLLFTPYKEALLHSLAHNRDPIATACHYAQGRSLLTFSRVLGPACIFGINDIGVLPVHAATANREMLQMMLRLGGESIATQEKHGVTPLIISLFHADPGIREDLWNIRDVREDYQRNWVARISSALRTGDESLVMALLNFCPQGLFVARDLGIYSIHAAVGHLETLKSMISLAGEEVAILEKQGVTPLILSLFQEDPTVRDYLWSLESVQKDYQLHWSDRLVNALKSGNTKVAQALLNFHPQDLRIPSCECGLTPVHIAAKRGDVALLSQFGGMQSLEELLACPVRDELTPLHFLCWSLVDGKEICPKEFDWIFQLPDLVLAMLFTAPAKSGELPVDSIIASPDRALQERFTESVLHPLEVSLAALAAENNINMYLSSAGYVLTLFQRFALHPLCPEDLRASCASKTLDILRQIRKEFDRVNVSTFRFEDRFIYFRAFSQIADAIRQSPLNEQEFAAFANECNNTLNALRRWRPVIEPGLGVQIDSLEQLLDFISGPPHESLRYGELAPTPFCKDAWEKFVHKAAELDGFETLVDLLSDLEDLNLIPYWFALFEQAYTTLPTAREQLHWLLHKYDDDAKAAHAIVIGTRCYLDKIKETKNWDGLNVIISEIINPDDFERFSQCGHLCERLLISRMELLSSFLKDQVAQNIAHENQSELFALLNFLGNTALTDMIADIIATYKEQLEAVQDPIEFQKQVCVLLDAWITMNLGFLMNDQIKAGKAPFPEMLKSFIDISLSRFSTVEVIGVQFKPEETRIDLEFKNHEDLSIIMVAKYNKAKDRLIVGVELPENTTEFSETMIDKLKQMETLFNQHRTSQGIFFSINNKDDQKSFQQLMEWLARIFDGR